MERYLYKIFYLEKFIILFYGYWEGDYNEWFMLGGFEIFI